MNRKKNNWILFTTLIQSNLDLWTNFCWEEETKKKERDSRQKGKKNVDILSPTVWIKTKTRNKRTTDRIKKDTQKVNIFVAWSESKQTKKKPCQQYYNAKDRQRRDYHRKDRKEKTKDERQRTQKKKQSSHTRTCRLQSRVDKITMV